MRLLSTDESVTEKVPKYIQAADLRDTRVIQWTMVGTGTMKLWGRMDPNHAWLEILSSTLSDSEPVKLHPQIAITVADLVGTLIVDVDVEIEMRTLNGSNY